MKSLVNQAFTLTPTRPRRARQSFSPARALKWTSAIPPSTSATFSSSSASPVALPIAPTAALEFEEFSYWDDDDDLTEAHVTREQENALIAYLEEHFQATDFETLLPYIIIYCEGEPPSEENRPFSIAGAIAIWKDDQDRSFKPHVGDLGQADPIALDRTWADKMEYFKVPPREVVLYLANELFPECEAISVLWKTIVVELPSASPTDHFDRLNKLPCGIDLCPFQIRFRNGPLPDAERRKRVIQPKPKVLAENVYDSTDYVKTDSRFYPGTMLSSVDENGNAHTLVTAGILVKKGEERRLTCSYHCWEKQVDEFPDQFGASSCDAKKTFNVVQGEPGTSVGFVRERIGPTDIALAQLHEGIVFENKFMELDAVPRRFLASSEQQMGDRYLVDSFVTGKQVLIGFGRRFALAKRASARSGLAVPPGAEGLMPLPNVNYIRLEQGAYSTSSLLILKKPEIRDSICGAVILRTQLAAKKRKPTPRPVIERGEIGAMMHFADLQSAYKSSDKAEDYLIFADAFDPLVEDGWTIVQEQEDEHIRPETELEEEEGSPSKKRKTSEDE